MAKVKINRTKSNHKQLTLPKLQYTFTTALSMMRSKNIIFYVIRDFDASLSTLGNYTLKRLNDTQ